MADVLIVCVREDEPQAKALAEMFEAAGFSIGGAPSSDAGLRSSGAGLIVWSQASIRSRPFLDAAQRVINAEKAVVASLIEPPPPSSIGDSPVFDLSHWNGDPNDPSLDPLFFAVDRMVSAARTSVGADTAEADYPPPAREAYAPPRETQRTQRAAPAPPAPSYTRTPPPASDPLGSEAEHWRAIRDSRDPADFMDYLARYGPQGAFAEVAELRLKQLTAKAEPKPAPIIAPRPQPAPAPRPTPRLEAPPSRRAELPSTRRPDPPPTRRADPPRRFERSYERPDLRDPPKEGGGAMRAFVLIALLGGAALAGGLYFGGGMPDFASTPASQEEQLADFGSPPPADYESESGDVLEEAPSVPLSSTVDQAPRRTEVAARRETEQRPAPAPEQRAEADPPTPAPVFNPGVGGPVSLRPGDQPASSSSTTTPAGPTVLAANTAPATTQPASSVPAATRPTPARGSVTFAQRPSARRISELYPDRALRQGVGGRVELNCRVQASQALSCTVANETPAGMGFGRAALSASTSYRANARLSDGETATGASTRIVVQFQAPSE